MTTRKKRNTPGERRLLPLTAEEETNTMQSLRTAVAAMDPPYPIVTWAQTQTVSPQMGRLGGFADGDAGFKFGFGVRLKRREPQFLVYQSMGRVAGLDERVAANQPPELRWFDRETRTIGVVADPIHKTHDPEFDGEECRVRAKWELKYTGEMGLKMIYILSRICVKRAAQAEMMFWATILMHHDRLTDEQAEAVDRMCVAHEGCWNSLLITEVLRTRINWEYITGLFCADGYIGSRFTGESYDRRWSIGQSSCVPLLQAIQVKIGSDPDVHAEVMRNPRCKAVPGHISADSLIYTGNLVDVLVRKVYAIMWTPGTPRGASSQKEDQVREWLEFWHWWRHETHRPKLKWEFDLAEM
jgi:hypothetical protein